VTGKQTASTVLPPFSGELKVDKNLKLSHEYFKQSMEQFYANKQLSAIDQLKTTPPYPKPHLLAQFANMAYSDCKHGDPKPPDGWQLLTTASHVGMKNGYFGTAYWHPEHQQVVIAHRGTDITNVGALVADVKGVLFNNYVQQMSSASTFANKVVAVLQEIEQGKKVIFEVFFTGHSLGGWLAQITTFTTDYLEVKGGTFLKKLKRGKDKMLASSTVQGSHDVQDILLAQDTVFTFQYNKDNPGVFLENGNTKQGEQEASSTVQGSHDVQDILLEQDTVSTFQYIKDNPGVFLENGNTKQGEQKASSTVQGSHDVQDILLAQDTVFTFQYNKDNPGVFLENGNTKQGEQKASSTVQGSHDVRQNYHPHTLVFDSPGCKDMLSQMADKLDVRLRGHSIVLQHLDITSYLSAPNLINTCNSHLGTVYRIFTDLSEMGPLQKHTPLYNLATHSMDKIVQAFGPETGKGKDDKVEQKVQEVVDWPVSASLTGGAEYNAFFQWAEHLNNYHPQVKDTLPSEVPKGYHQLRYQTKAYDDCTKSQSIFMQDERKFLERYRLLRDLKDFFQPEDLFCVVNDAKARKEAEEKLQNFELSNESVSCPDADTLHALIPYVKRLVRLFPHIKQKTKDQLSSARIRNKVYQHETEHYVRKIRQIELDFNPGALGVTEFLTSDQQIWQLRMNDGDTWRGLTKVYSVLKNASCTPNYFGEGCYTILELERLLTVNRMINLNELLTSMKAPHLLMIACGNNQPVNVELENLFDEWFSILKKNNNTKIILTAKSEGDITDCIQQIAIETFGEEGFIKTDEQLTWSDLTDSSQRKLLEKTVIFQGRSVALNQLISAESVRDSFPLTDLLQETEIRIGEEPVTSDSSGYNEEYYIDRTFNHHIVVKKDITSGKREGKFADLLASTEKEFKQLCQHNSTSNVHWLQKEKSGELIWWQSQGSLQTLRKYVDGQKSRSYAPSDLDKLLQQAMQQRTMLIADTAGMGKSTVLTHLSKRITEKFPAHWLVRVDLNNYTDLLEVEKGSKMDKGWVLDFISKKVLKLESDLENELFKKSFEGNETSKLVVMLDGFDEISPHYQETVIDTLQVLK
jgi:hypothetical protein